MAYPADSGQADLNYETSEFSALEDFNPSMFEGVGLTPEDLEQIWCV